jgi:tetratricopeptide (TPR) repeat protein
MKIKNGPRRRRPIALAIGLAGLATGCHHLPHTAFHPAQHPPSILDGGDRQVRLNGAQEADVQIALGRTLERQGDIPKAMAAYQDALRRDAHRADAYLRLAVLNDRQGKFAESAELYQQALSARPGDPDIYSDKGYSLYLQRRWAEAEMSLRQAIVLKPDHARAHNNLGLVLAQTGRLDPALAEFHQGGCSPADAQINLAYALTLQRRWPEARQHFQLALAADGTSAPARDGLAQLDRLMAKAPESSPPSAPRDAAIATVGMTAAPPSPPLPPPPPPRTPRAGRIPRAVGLRPLRDPPHHREARADGRPLTPGGAVDAGRSCCSHRPHPRGSISPSPSGRGPG